jgi:hypothetical protein
MVSVRSSLTTFTVFSSLGTTSIPLVTLSKLLFGWLQHIVVSRDFIANMENQQRSRVPRTELNNQQLSYRPQGEQFEHQLTASVNNFPGMGDR